MIFTARFGALAARPTFPSITEIVQDDVSEVQVHDVVNHYRSSEYAA